MYVSQQEQEVTQQIYDFFSELMEKFGFKLSEEHGCPECDNMILYLEKKTPDFIAQYSIDISEAIKKGNKQ